MQNKTMKGETHPKLPTREELILTEQEIVNELRRMMQDPSLSLKDRLRAAAVLSFHMNTLNRMLSQDYGTDAFEEQNLGDLVRNM